MAGDTNIEWATKVWNPVVGCSVVSPGCTNCYAMKMAARIESMAAGRGESSSYDGLTIKSKGGAVWTGEMRLVEGALPLPLRWRKPAGIFVNSMSDLFHESVPDAWIDHVFAVMALASQHTFMILTKRPERMRRYLTDPDRIVRMLEVEVDHPAGRRRLSDLIDFVVWAKPLPNVWLGVSVEDQPRAAERIPLLLTTPAAVRFLSAEPLLGPIDPTNVWPDITASMNAFTGKARHLLGMAQNAAGVDWVIVGGESGPGARPMHPDWPRQIRDACAAASVPFFFKQWGAWAACQSNDGAWPTRGDYCRRLMLDGECGQSGWPMQRVGKRAAGRLLDGVEHNAMPEGRS